MKLLVFILIFVSMLMKAHSFLRRDCQSSCGGIPIRYPFGTSRRCYYDQNGSFNLTCENQKLKWRGLDVINTSYDGSLRVQFPISYLCYNRQRNLKNESHKFFELSTMSLSNNNNLIGVGCDTSVLLENSRAKNHIHKKGCLSICSDPPEKGLSSIEGFCQTSILKGNNFTIRVSSFNKQSFVHRFNPCSYAFIVENGFFNFEAKEDLLDLRNVTHFPVLLDWSIGNKRCDQVGKASLCRRNSRCVDSFSRDIGYLCRCDEGYDGSPYAGEGCKDIDECSNGEHDCDDQKSCRNNNGGFTCECRFGYYYRHGRGCRPNYVQWVIILFGTTVGFFVLLIASICITQKIRHHRKCKQLRQHFFEQNGGVLLRERLAGPGSSNAEIRIFTEECMKTATNGYDERRILGEGGQGTVYRGTLPDNSTVAIKRAKLGHRSQVEHFINEMHMLSTINHRNVVKLLGCCLETEVPLLIYEYVDNGTLYDHLHGPMAASSSLTWEDRLRIAIEVAGTLSYLHSSTTTQVIHRDIKTANILLDDHLTAKVADFGASKFIPLNKEQLTTMVHGTMGYLDPEYQITGSLTEKSDVYSFGVVLMELLSSEKAVSFDRPEEPRHLVSYFTCATQEKRLGEIIQGYVMTPENAREIEEVAKIAVNCTRVMREHRPQMKEIATELENIKNMKSKNKAVEYTEASTSRIEQVLFGDPRNFNCDSIASVSFSEFESGR